MNRPFNRQKIGPTRLNQLMKIPKTKSFCIEIEQNTKLSTLTLSLTLDLSDPLSHSQAQLTPISTHSQSFTQPWRRRPHHPQLTLNLSPSHGVGDPIILSSLSIFHLSTASMTPPSISLTHLATSHDTYVLNLSHPPSNSPRRPLPRSFSPTQPQATVTHPQSLSPTQPQARATHPRPSSMLSLSHSQNTKSQMCINQIIWSVSEKESEENERS